MHNSFRLRPRWRKVLADLWGNKTRTILVVLSIAVGTFAVGLVSSAYTILSTDMDRDYQSVNPHAAIIYSDSFDDDFLQAIRHLAGIQEAEGRTVIFQRLQRNGNQKIPIAILAIPPTKDMLIDHLRPVGTVQSLTLRTHEIWIERSGAEALDLHNGDLLTVELDRNQVRQLRVSAIMHDVSATPYVFTGQLQTYVNADTMVWLGGSRDPNELFITVPKQQLNLNDVNRIAKKVEDQIEKSGRTVIKTTISQPGKHFASDFILAMGILLGVLGVLAVCLSAFLAVNTITALLSQHIRQIGIMKLIGGQTRQLVLMYVSLVFGFGLLAWMLALPLAGVLAYQLSTILARFLNFDLGGFRIPPMTIVLQAVVALLVPVLVALAPVLHGANRTVQAAISDVGINASNIHKGWLDRMIERARGLPRPLLLSLRNVFRRKGRLALTLIALTMGGSIFMAVFNVRSSLQLVIQQALGYFLSDVNVTLNHTYRMQRLEPALRRIPGVVTIEGWGAIAGQVYGRNGVNTDEVILSAPPLASKLIQPVMSSGRWLQSGDENALVISNHLIKKRPDLKVGDEVVIKINGQDLRWRIVGICSIAGHMPTPVVYVGREYLEKLLDNKDQVADIHIITTPQDAFTQERVAGLIETQMRQMHVQVGTISTGMDSRKRLTVIIDLLVDMLLVLATLIALVGSIGLTGMMSQNVMERNREIGILRAIGAADTAIQQIVLAEGLCIGWISWILGLALAIPMSYLLEQALGDPVSGGPLPSVLISWEGPALWLAGITVLSALSCYLPAYRASRLTIREVLAYE
jgi:putative ABC transport system permease protein